MIRGLTGKINRRISIDNKLKNASWREAVNVAASMCNRDAFSELKNSYKGKEVVVCGAGPSLADYHPIENAIHIALNRALLYEKVKYDYFFADDWEGISFFKDEIIKYDCKKYLGYCCGNIGHRVIPESFRIAAGAKKYYLDSYMSRPMESKLVLDIDKMAISNQFNMGLEIMQVALFMNPSKIYLVGLDSDSSGHFYEVGLTKEKLDKHKEDLKKYADFKSVKTKWIAVKEFAETYYPDTEIISINPVGLKGLFKDEYQ